MLFVFGTRSKTVVGPRKEVTPCDACGNAEHVSSGVLRYFHVFFIPFFPIGKKPVLQCANCRKTLVSKEIPEPARSELSAELFPARRTVPLFAGLIAIGLVVGYGAIANRASEARYAELLRNPSAGDVYVVKLSAVGLGATTDAQHPYGILQAAKVADGELQVRVAKYVYTRPFQALGATRHGLAFQDGALKLRVDDLQRMHSDGALSAVTRP